MIFNDQPEISSDLEWILLSGQANRGMLLETLVKDHGVQIYQLAYAVLNNKNQAEQYHHSDHPASAEQNPPFQFRIWGGKMVTTSLLANSAKER